MINHFNAFISYKHAELDNKIAEAIVRDLEHFHIPGKIRKSTGIKKIERVFRDKDELPITSDLNETITQALENSDYLIVICSTNTKKSTWVEREIDTFLKNHSINNILTVLADGEPYDVIPKRLLSYEKTFTDEKGETHTEQVPYEPLSCDFRLPKRKARTEELPRLVAAIIGCSYDELINRQRQYKLRRMMTFFSLALALAIGFAGYMLYSNTLIHKNYIESLKNQSRYLANESGKKLDEGNRIEAMELALAALPGDSDKDRPVTAEAEKALTKASMAYVTLQGTNVSAAWNYDMPNTILDFDISKDKSYLAAYDNKSNIAIWDIATHKQILFDDEAESHVKKMVFTEDGKLLVLRGDSITAYDEKTGEKLWQDGELELYNAQHLFEAKTGNALLIDIDGTVHKYRISDGKETESFSISLEEDYVIDDCVISEDGKRLAFTTYNITSADDQESCLYEYNMDNGEMASVTLPAGHIEDMAYRDKYLFVSHVKGDEEKSVRLFQYHFVTKDTTDVYCFVPGTLEQKWMDTHSCTDISIKSGFVDLMNGNILYYKGNTESEWNVETGELTDSYDINDSIVSAMFNPEIKEPVFVSSEGYAVSKIELNGKKGLNETKYFTDDLIKAYGSRGYYTLCYDSNQIIYYGVSVCDEEWTPFEGGTTFNMSGNAYYMNDDMLFVFYPEGDCLVMDKYDLASKKYLGKSKVSNAAETFNKSVAGVYDNIMYIGEYLDSSFYLTKIDLATDKVEQELLGEGLYIGAPKCELVGDKLVYVNKKDNGDWILIVRDLSDNAMKETEYPCGQISDIYPFSEQGLVYVAGENDMIVDVNNNESIEVELPDEYGETEEVSFDDTAKTMAISDTKKILIYDKDRKLTGEIPCENQNLSAVYCFDNGNEGGILVAFYSDGSLYRYNSSTGEFIGKTDLSSNSLSASNTTIEYDESLQLLYVCHSGQMSIVQTSSWVETAYISDCLGHHEATDTYITCGYEKTSAEAKIGFFRHYTVEELIRKAKDILQGMEMSKDEKTIYGIE